MAEQQPTWQTGDCPVWCSGGHRDDDHPSDRVHRSNQPTVPVVSRAWSGTGFELDADDFEVGLSRSDDEPDTWVYIGSGPGQHIEVTIESARRLAHRLCAMGELGGR